MTTVLAERFRAPAAGRRARSLWLLVHVVLRWWRGTGSV